MTATEAKEKLEAWRDILKLKLEFAEKGPWYANDNGQIGGVFTKKGDVICGGDPHEGWMDPEGWESEFIAFSGSAVPAMLAGIEAVLKDHEKIASLEREDSLTEYGRGSFAESCQTLFSVARAYGPYFQEITGK